MRGPCGCGGGADLSQGGRWSERSQWSNGGQWASKGQWPGQCPSVDSVPSTWSGAAACLAERRLPSAGQWSNGEGWGSERWLPPGCGKGGTMGPVLAPGKLPSPVIASNKPAVMQTVLHPRPAAVGPAAVIPATVKPPRPAMAAPPLVRAAPATSSMPVSVARRAHGVDEEPVELYGDELWFANRHQRCLHEWRETSEDGLNDCTGALQTMDGVLGAPSPVVDAGADPLEAVFRQAAKVLQALVGFRGEGNVSQIARTRAISRAPMQLVWRGLSPMSLITQWVHSQTLLSVFSGAPLRRAFDLAERRFQINFLCALLRVASLEALQQGADPLRLQWGDVFKLFPEARMVRTLFRHIRRRCWEDVRDRSRSRSRSRDRQKQNQANEEGHDGVRFFVKGCGLLEEDQIGGYFGKFGSVVECSVLKHKKTKKTRGMAFVTVRPRGFYKGQRNTEDGVRNWVLEQATHSILGHQLEVTEAKQKPVEDEDQKREERVEERRKQREEREQRHGRPEVGPVSMVPSPWAKRWRKEISLAFPKDVSGASAPVTHPAVMALSRAIWREAADHASRCGTPEVQEAVLLFRSDGDGQGSAGWAYLPAVDILLLVGEGLVGVTAEGVCLSEAKREPLRPAATLPAVMPPVPAGKTLMCASASATPIGGGVAANTAMPTPSVGVAAADVASSCCGGGVGGGSAGSVGTAAAAAAAFVEANCGSPSVPVNSKSMGTGRCWERGSEDEFKVFVGGLTQKATLEMLTAHFSKYGTITDAVVMVEKGTGKPRGFGFVVFDRAVAVDQVLADYDHHRVDGKWVEVKKATPHPGPIVGPGAAPQTAVSGALPQARANAGPQAGSATATTAGVGAGVAVGDTVNDADTIGTGAIDQPTASDTGICSGSTGEVLNGGGIAVTSSPAVAPQRRPFTELSGFLSLAPSSTGHSYDPFTPD
eukprot:TRINITY_DN42823_c0_g1_i1.p1 TRINITY_DN42823_c0_g1~~TRINITY_DN42823_c0_g1_i1.p1  ORF type:complete len:937 (-),score=166.00 TRINITY_DN42823_c0_g1_i1:105-2915(-)